jgi:hypothetical protein
MRSRWLLFTALLSASGCAYGVGDGFPGGAVHYQAVDNGSPYLPGSPVYGAPYRQGPVMGGIYVYGDDEDDYGGPIFSPYHGIRCDRRRQACWSQYGQDDRWTGRFFGHRHSNWDHADWKPSDQNGQGGNGQGGNRPVVYQVPKRPDGSGAPTFLPNGCGAAGQPPCH